MSGISRRIFLQRAFVALVFFIWAITAPYLSLLSPIIYFGEDVRIPFPERNSYSMLEGTDMLTSVVGLNVNLLFLLLLVLILALQMLVPWRTSPIHDGAVNLVISSVVLFAWYLYLSSIVVLIPLWQPMVDITIPVAGMAMVPINRLFIPYAGKRVIEVLQLPAEIFSKPPSSASWIVFLLLVDFPSTIFLNSIVGEAAEPTKIRKTALSKKILCKVDLFQNHRYRII